MVYRVLCWKVETRVSYQCALWLAVTLLLAHLLSRMARDEPIIAMYGGRQARPKRWDGSEKDPSQIAFFSCPNRTISFFSFESSVGWQESVHRVLCGKVGSQAGFFFSFRVRHKRQNSGFPPIFELPVNERYHAKQTISARF